MPGVISGIAPGGEGRRLALENPPDVHEVVRGDVVGDHGQVEQVAERDAVG